jgi:spermidine synthase
LGGAIALTDFDEALYSECLVHPSLSTAPNAEHVLILGGGDGGVAREVLRYAGVKRVTVVEIDREVVEVCRRFFPTAASCLNDPRVDLVIDDAHRYLRDCPHHFDCIIVDACELTNVASDAFHAMTFADAVFRRLTPAGILVTPLGCPTFSADECRATLRTLERIPQTRVYLMNIPSFPGGQWAVARCQNGTVSDTPAPQAWHRTLRCWHPGLQASLFALPRNVESQLGLGKV